MRKKSKKFDSCGETVQHSRELAMKKLTKGSMVKVSPMNDNQQKFIDLYNDGFELICVTGYAGTSKSFMSMYCALNDVLEEGSEYHKLIIIRSAVQTRDQGFLPGEQEDKDAPFEEPYEQIMKQLFHYNNPYKHAKAFGNIEFKTTGNLRGQTFDNAIVIVDEVQNMDFNEISTVIERIGINSRIIIAGDRGQIDLDRKRGQKSGFDELIGVLERMKGCRVGFVEYGVDDIVRSGVVKSWLMAKYNL